MLADDHALVDGIAGLDEEGAAGLKVEEGVGHAHAGAVGNDASRVAGGEVAAPGLVAFEVGVHDARALGVGEELVLVADEAAGGHGELDAHAAGAGIVAVEHLALALVELVRDHAHEVLVAVHVEMLDGLEYGPALVLLQDDFGTPHGELEALAAHGLDEDGQLELAPALDQEGVVASGVLDAYGHVAQGLLGQTLLDDAALEELALAAGQGRGVDAKAHGDRRLVHGDAGKRRRIFARADGVADGDVLDAGQHDHVAWLHLVHLAQGYALVDLELGGAQGPGLAVGADAVEGLVAVHRAVHDPAHGEAAEVVGVVEVGDEHLEGLVRIVVRSGKLGQDGLEERLEVHPLVVGMVHGNAVAAHGVEHRELELAVVGAKVDEEVVDFVDHLFDARVLAVDLVDDHDDRQMRLEGLAQHEARLREGAFRGVHEQDGAAGHGERALDLAAEVGVARGVDDVDLDALPGDGAVLGRNGDPALALEIHVVHDAVLHLLVLSENAALLEEGINKGGFAVIDVGNDGHVAEILVLHGVFLHKINGLPVFWRRALYPLFSTLSPCLRRKNAACRCAQRHGARNRTRAARLRPSCLFMHRTSLKPPQLKKSARLQDLPAVRQGFEKRLKGLDILKLFHQDE